MEIFHIHGQIILPEGRCSGYFAPSLPLYSPFSETIIFILFYFCLLNLFLLLTASMWSIYKCLDIISYFFLRDYVYSSLSKGCMTFIG